MGLPDEFGISGAVFTDAGTLWTVDNNTNTDDDASLRWSAGAGIAWKSPFGPVRVDVAKAILKEDFDEEEAVRFRFGTRFWMSSRLAWPEVPLCWGVGFAFLLQPRHGRVRKRMS